MLLRHTGYYLLARGLPGIVSFFALSVYTRLLGPSEYGRYSLAIATVSLVGAVLFQWLGMCVLRFLPRYAEVEAQLLSNLLAAYFSLVLLTGFMAYAADVLLPLGHWRPLLLPALVLLWVQAWYELNLQLLASRFRPALYGGLAGSRALLSILVGAGLGWLGWGAEAPLVGLAVGGLLPALWFSTGGAWRGLRRAYITAPRLNELTRYGLPLGMTFVFGFIVSTSDRYLIAIFMDEPSVGLYAAAYDLAQASLGVLMMIVCLAAYPVIMRSFERDGEEAARAQLDRYWLLLMAIAAPSAAGFMVLADNIASVLLGANFEADAASLLPWIAGSAVVGGAKAYYFDVAFQLRKQTTTQVLIVAIAGFINVLLNLWLIPSFGLLGAAWATLAAYTVALCLSAIVGARYFKLSAFPTDIARLTAAVLTMVVVVWIVRAPQGLWALLGQIALGMTCYAVSLYVFNPGGVRGSIA